MVRLPPAVIVAAGGHVTALVTQDLTKEIPIVFTMVTDPVKDGLVASLNRPGGNATGSAGLTSELDPKRLELLHVMKPSAGFIGVLVNPNRPGLYDQSRELQQAADRLGVKLTFQNGATDREIDSAFEAFVSQGVQALLVTADPLFNNRRAQILTLAAKYSLPAIYQWREFVSAGGLMSYGPSITAAYRHAGVLAGLILNGAKPADLPVMQPARFQLVINSNTARQISTFLLNCIRRLVAHRVNSRQRSTSVAFGAKRKWTEPRFSELHALVAELILSESLKAAD
jgi:putative tryptophan/tyrosine transport system substrate-binding protein